MFVRGLVPCVSHSLHTTGGKARLFNSKFSMNFSICILTSCVFPCIMKAKLFRKELEDLPWTTPTVATLTEVTFTAN